MTNSAVIVAGSLACDFQETVRAHLDELPEALLTQLNSMPRPLIEFDDRALQATGLAALAGIASAAYHVASGRFFGLRKSVGRAMLGSYGLTLAVIVHELSLRSINQRLYVCPVDDFYAVANR